MIVNRLCGLWLTNHDSRSGFGGVYQLEGYVYQLCTSMCTSFEKQKSEQSCGFEQCVPCVPPKFELKFDLKKKEVFFKNCKYNLKKLVHMVHMVHIDLSV